MRVEVPGSGMMQGPPEEDKYAHAGQTEYLNGEDDERRPLTAGIGRSRNLSSWEVRWE